MKFFLTCSFRKISKGREATIIVVLEFIVVIILDKTPLIALFIVKLNAALISLSIQAS